MEREKDLLTERGKIIFGATAKAIATITAMAALIGIGWLIGQT